jgi:hypothetical protein
MAPLEQDYAFALEFSERPIGSSVSRPVATWFWLKLEIGNNLFSSLADCRWGLAPPDGDRYGGSANRDCAAGAANLAREF